MKKLTIIMAIAAIALMAPIAPATELTFDIIDSFQDDYGDRVDTETNGVYTYGGACGWTPNVAIEYDTDDNTWLYVGDENYGNLNNVLVMDTDGSSGYSICLRADAGYRVKLHGFDLAKNIAALTLDGVSVTNGAGNVLFEASSLNLGLDHISVDYATPLTGRVLKINIDTSNLDPEFGSFGIDNIKFSQVEGRRRQLARFKTGAVEESSWSEVKGLFR